jgi:3-hydroxybutyryl-CoA dehydrogenase
MDGAAIGILGSGTMGIGIAQVAAGAGHGVVIADADAQALAAAQAGLARLLAGLVGKGRMAADASAGILSRIRFAGIPDFAS